MNVFLWNARARNGHVEATLNHPFPAQVRAPYAYTARVLWKKHSWLSVISSYDPQLSRGKRSVIWAFNALAIMVTQAVMFLFAFPTGICDPEEPLGRDECLQMESIFGDGGKMCMFIDPPEVVEPGLDRCQLAPPGSAAITMRRVVLIFAACAIALPCQFLFELVFIRYACAPLKKAGDDDDDGEAYEDEDELSEDDDSAARLLHGFYHQSVESTNTRSFAYATRKGKAKVRTFATGYSRAIELKDGLWKYVNLYLKNQEAVKTLVALSGPVEEGQVVPPEILDGVPPLNLEQFTGMDQGLEARISKAVASPAPAAGSAPSAARRPPTPTRPPTTSGRAQTKRWTSPIRKIQMTTRTVSMMMMMPSHSIHLNGQTLMEIQLEIMQI